MLLKIVYIKKIIVVIGSQWVNKHSSDFSYHSERLFEPKLPSECSINMENVPSFRFPQCFRPFTMLLGEVSSETGLFKHLSNHVFRIF